MTSRYLHLALASCNILLLLACSSSGNSVSRAVSAPRTVNPPASVHPDLVPYLPRFTSVVEALGFRIAPTDDPNALQLKLEFNPNIINMRVSVALWQNGVPIVTADATNSGWGTALARGTAINKLVDSAAAHFDIEIRKISTTLRIVDDSARETILAVPAEGVKIESNIPNADVYIDGKFVGNAPLNSYRLPVGDHQIEVVSEGYAAWRRTLTIIGGAATRVAATLNRAKP